MRLLTTLLLGLAAVAGTLAHDQAYHDILAQYGVKTQYEEDDTSIDRHYIRSTGHALKPFNSSEALKMDMNDLPEGPITWIGPVDDSGHNISITGSNRFVRNKLKSLGAHHMFRNHHPFRNHTQHAKRGLASGNRELDARYARIYYECNNGYWQQGSCIAENQADSYVEEHYAGGLCMVGSNACGRFACSYDTATLMCNTGPQVVIPCALLGYNVDFIFAQCTFSKLAVQFGIPELCRSQGQAFYRDPYYNVLMKHTGPGNGC